MLFSASLWSFPSLFKINLHTFSLTDFFPSHENKYSGTPPMIPYAWTAFATEYSGRFLTKSKKDKSVMPKTSSINLLSASIFFGSSFWNQVRDEATRSTIISLPSKNWLFKSFKAFQSFASWWAIVENSSKTMRILPFDFFDKPSIIPRKHSS